MNNFDPYDKTQDGSENPMLPFDAGVEHPQRIEARTVANLDHPGIVPVHDVGSMENCPCYIVSKYIPGTLDRFRQ